MSSDTSVNTTFLYCNSANAGSDNADVTIEIPEDSWRCRDDEFIKLSLSQFSMVCNLFNITDNNNMITYSFSGNTAVHSMEPGNYRVAEYVEAFNAVSGIGVVCTYRSKQNQMRFSNTRSVPTTLQFQGTLSWLFGLKPSHNSITIPASSTLDSPSMIIPRFCNDLVLKIGGVFPGPPVNISNLEGAGVTSSTILGIIPLRAAPGQLAVYHNISNVFSCQIYDQDVQRIALQVCDITGTKIVNCPSWVAVLKVEIFRRPPTDETLKALTRLVEYARLNFLQMNLR